MFLKLRFLRFFLSPALSVGLFFIFALALFLYMRSETQVYHLEELRFRSFLLADELRQSSDDMTRMFRSYIETADPFYKKSYEDVLDIRKGKKPRPEEYWRVYWDLVPRGGEPPRPDSGQTVPLLELMRQTGFSAEEFQNLQEAESKSNALAVREREAMRLVEEAGPDAAENKAKALRFAFGEDYRQAKAEIMKPIDEFFVLMDARLRGQLQDAQRYVTIVQYLLVLVGLGLSLVIIRSFTLIQDLMGGSVTDVAAHIARLGRRDFSNAPTLKDAPKNSLMGVLAETHVQLREAERRRADAERGNQYLAAIIDSANDGIISKDLNDVIVSWNQGAERLFGYRGDEIIGQLGTLLIPEDRLEDESQIVERIKRGERIPHLETTRIRKDGTRVDVSLTESPILDASGAVVGISKIVRDITDLHVALESLRQSEDRFRSTFEQAAVGMAHVAPDGKFLRINQRFCDIVQYTRDEVLNLTFQDITHPDDLNRDLSYVQQVLNHEISTYAMEKRYIRKGGEIVWINLTVSMVTTPAGAPDYLIGVVEDITERKDAETALQASEERFDLATRGTNDGLWDWNVVTNAVWFAPRFVELLGYGPEDEFPHLFESFASRLHPEDFDPTMEALRLHLEERQPYDVECRLRTRSGTYRWFRARGESVRDADGKPTRMAGSVQDITDRREALEALRRSNVELERKSQEVEAFVYIVSHDLRAPLVNIQGFCSELLTCCEELRDIVDKADLAPEMQSQIKQITDEEIAGALRFITAGTSRFERLIDALLRLSRTGRQEYRLDKVDVNALVKNAVDSLQATINSKDAVVQVDAMPDAFGDKTALEQVFSNLLSNALNYLAPARKGNITLGGRVENEYCHYWIADNGLGFPKSAKERIFRVFQRFHPDRATGEGMGLAIAKRVVDRHDGDIWVESSEGEGTTFHFRLPMQAAETGNTNEGNEVQHGKP